MLAVVREIRQLAYTPFGTLGAVTPGRVREFAKKEKAMTRTNNKGSRKKPISRVLRKTIRDKGLTAYATAKQAGVSVDAVQRFMKDQRGLSLETVDKLAGALDLTLCDDDTNKGTT
jgi:DNA-binding phage protein